MSGGMCDSVLQASRKALDQFGMRKDSDEGATAAVIIQHFQRNNPGEWSCVVGPRFGCSLSIGN